MGGVRKHTTSNIEHHLIIQKVTTIYYKAVVGNAMSLTGFGRLPPLQSGYL